MNNKPMSLTEAFKALSTLGSNIYEAATLTSDNVEVQTLMDEIGKIADELLPEIEYKDDKDRYWIKDINVDTSSNKTKVKFILYILVGSYNPDPIWAADDAYEMGKKFKEQFNSMKLEKAGDPESIFNKFKIKLEDIKDDWCDEASFCYHSFFYQPSLQLTFSAIKK